MPKRISILLMLMMAYSLCQAQSTLSRYRYWIDNGDMDSVVTNSQHVSLTPDISSQSEGTHFFYFQARNSKGKWGQLHKYMYYIAKAKVQQPEKKLTYGEYWLDDNFDSRKQMQMNGSTASQVISLTENIDHLAAGVHFFRYRLQNDAGEWSIPISHMFLYAPLKEVGAPVNYYETWLDDDYEGTKKSGTPTGTGSVTVDYDLSTMAPGSHFLYFRARNAYGQWGTVSKYLFYIAPPQVAQKDATLTMREYWLNDDYASRKTAKASTMETFSIDISHLKQGLHYFSYRAQNTNGEWGEIVRKSFYVVDKYAVKGAPITAYRYTLNKTTVTKRITETSYYQNELTLPLPTDFRDVATIDDSSKFTFNKAAATARIDRNVNCFFSMQFQNKGGNWSAPVDTSFAMKDSLIRTITPLSINRSLTYNKMLQGDFQAFSITPDKAGTYYLNASQECQLMIYDAESSQRIANLELYELKNSYEAQLEAKTYYCILYNTITDDMNTSDKVSIRFMLTKNAIVPDPVITYENGVVTISNEMAEAKIYYTTDGTDPVTSGSRKIYEAPFTVDGNAVIKAVAEYEGYNPSSVVTYTIKGLTVARPMISYSNNMVTITCETEKATIWYTLDGSDPLTSATRHQYSAPFQMTGNCVVKAVAKRDGYETSAIVEFVIDMFSVASPTVSFANNLLTISCETANATIYYEIGSMVNPATSPVYTQPIELKDNRTVFIVATKAGLENSEMVFYTPTNFTCEAVRMTYDGRMITMSTTTKGAKILYTTDGTEPDANSEEYIDPIILDGLCTIKAVATKDYTNSSNIASYQVPAFYNGEKTYVKEAGNLTTAYQWCGIENIYNMDVVGNINKSDLAEIKKFTALKHLNLAEAVVTEEELPSEAFAGMNLLTLSTPVKIQTIGSNLLKGVKTIGAIEWNVNTTVPADILGGVVNPNMLLYVKQAGYADTDKFRNIVVGESADNIVLTDAAEYGNFYCIKPFTANSITYSHNYGMETVLNECQGWEAISLPFDVQTIVHENKGELAPFLNNDGMKKPFWLYSMNYGFSSASTLKANTPYIICMPNSEDYADDYILGGKVTFSSRNVTIPRSSEITIGKDGDMLFKPTFQLLPASDTVMTLNIYQEHEGNNPGSVFVGNLRAAKPFEAYVTSESNRSLRGVVMKIDSGTTGIEEVPALRGRDIYSENGVLYINATSNCEVKLYNTGGQLVRILSLTTGLNEIRDLSKGVYLVKGLKIIIK